jgi:hypothetical protein
MAMSDTNSIVTDTDSKINCQRSASNTIAHSGFKLAKVAPRRLREESAGLWPPSGLFCPRMAEDDLIDPSISYAKISLGGPPLLRKPAFNRCRRPKGSPSLNFTLV